MARLFSRQACLTLPVRYQDRFPLYGDDADVMFCSIEAVCWGFNGILAFTWPLLSVAFTPSGAVRTRLQTVRQQLLLT